MGREYIAFYKIAAYRRPSDVNPAEPGVYITKEGPYTELFPFHAENHEEAWKKAEEGKKNFNDKYWEPKVEIEMLVKGKVIARDEKEEKKKVENLDSIERRISV